LTIEEQDMTRVPPIGISNLDFKLLNEYQRGFPLVSRPFHAIAQEIGLTEAAVIARIQHLQDGGVISRVGAVFRPNAIGVSTLAALAVPRNRFDRVAEYVSSLPQVNHNYEREHFFNLWFVATGPNIEHLLSTLRRIEEECKCGPVLYLPMLEEYHIDLGFDLTAADSGRKLAATSQGHAVLPEVVTLDDKEQKLVAALQDGLPIVPRPFNWLGMREPDALAAITRWIDKSIVKRFGVIVRHRELGYTANAMAVWNVPDDAVSEIGRRLADSGRVTLCYRRRRHESGWPYNLFCMIHGKDRKEVQARIASLASTCGLQQYPHAVLFSRRRFKQCGAHYEQHSAQQPGKDTERDYARA
jgi:siroheme decarboxylase